MPLVVDGAQVFLFWDHVSYCFLLQVDSESVGEQMDTWISLNISTKRWQKVIFAHIPFLRELWTELCPL